MASRGALGGRCRALMAALRSASASSAKTASGLASSTAKTASASASPAKAVRSSFGLMKMVSVSPQLGNFLGSTEASCSGAVNRVWEYVKLHDLQTPAKKEIFCDDKLKTIFDGKDSVGFGEIARMLSQHFKKT